MRGRPPAIAVVVIASAIALAGCGSAISSTGAPANITKPPITYVAIGGSESSELVSRGAIRSAWPQLLYRKAIGTAGTFVDLAQPGETAAEALVTDPRLLRSLHPALVTIWLNIADLLGETPVQRFERSLDAVVAAARATGATVLLANAPEIEHFALYQACVDDPAACGEKGRVLPSAAKLAVAVSAYNAAIVSVARSEGATVVDVAGALNRAASRDGGVTGLSGNLTALSASADAAVEAAFLSRLPKSIRRQ
ncbi:MAG: SGNH/GDSL hydrolase family protein [Acidimicrobiales bacterium]